MSTLCDQCGEPLTKAAGAVRAGLSVRCIPCTTEGSRELRVGLLLEAWDRFTALRVPPKVDVPLYFTFEAQKGGTASLLLLPDDVRERLKIEAELASYRAPGMQPVVLALLTPGLEPLYIIKGYETVQSGGGSNWTQESEQVDQ